MRSSDRNLLFGVLALQMDFITRDDLIAALHAWVLAKHRPLGELLVERQARHADQRESQARFLREAVITGRLEHPGVVPVYGLGRHADGRPYYAMRLVKGQTLKDAIDRFHQADARGRDPGERALALRQ